MAREPGLPGRRPGPLGARGAVLLLLLAAALASAAALDLGPGKLAPGQGGLELAGRFFARAVRPAIAWEADVVPPGTEPLLVETLHAMGKTVLFAAAAMALSLVLGVVLGFLGSTAWWEGDPAGSTSPLLQALRRTVFPAVYAFVRVLIAVMRSVHELLWAVLMLTAFGTQDATAVLAIAIPYGGTLAKVFSEMVDEAPRGAALALRGAGASDLQVYVFGLIPRALPDMAAYSFYRFECALRSSAVLGFFGYETLGLYIKQSFNNALYGEVWTFLYAVFALVLVVDLWSGALRRRVVA